MSLCTGLIRDSRCPTFINAVVLSFIMVELVVFVGGGAMRGVFSAGALSALCKLGVREKVSAIYGISAGAFNAAHFALNTPERMVEWYEQQVPHSRIFQFTTPLAALRGREVIDMRAALEVLERTNLFDPKALQQCSTPVYFGVVNAESKEFVFKDARRPDSLELLRASSTIYPFVSEPVKIDGQRYIDGGYAESVSLTRLRKLHPNAKFIIVLNIDERTYSLKQVLAKMVVQLKDKSLATTWSESLVRAQKEFLDAQTAEDVLLFYPKKKFPVYATTTNTAALEEGLLQGYDAVMSVRERVLSFVEN